MTARQNVIALGLKFGADVRDRVKNLFWRAAAGYLPLETTALKTAAESLSAAGIAKKLGIPQSAIADLDPTVRQKAFPGAGTIVRFVGYARRWPNANLDVSLEAYSTAAAFAVRTGIAAKGEAADNEAERLVNEQIAENGRLSIRKARELWQDSPESNEAAAENPDTVGDRIDWLMSQGGAIEAYAAESAENRVKIATLGAFFTAITTETVETN